MTWKGPDPAPINEGHWAKGTPEYQAYRLLYKAWNLRQARRCRNSRGQGCRTSQKKFAAHVMAQAGTVMAQAAARHPPQSLAHTPVVGMPMDTPVTSRQDTITTVNATSSLLTVTATTTPPDVAPPPGPPAALNAYWHFQPHPKRKHPAPLRADMEAKIRAELVAEMTTTNAEVRAEVRARQPVLARAFQPVSPTPSYSPPPNSCEDHVAADVRNVFLAAADVRNEAMATVLGALDQAVHREANVALYGEVSAW
jgi:hypothetical protein